MPKIIDIKILSASNPVRLEMQIREMLPDWQPLGGHAVIGQAWATACQEWSITMVRYQES